MIVPLLTPLQFEGGDCVSEKPMWAESGGLDFHGREVWEWHTKAKTLSKDDAKAQFCQVCISNPNINP